MWIITEVRPLLRSSLTFSYFVWYALARVAIVPHCNRSSTRGRKMDNLIWNRSLLNPIWGSAIFLVLGLLFSEYVLLGWIGNTWSIFAAKMTVSLAFPIIYYLLCLQPEITVGARGVVKLLGKRIRMGPGGMGFFEGLNATPLPRGLMTVQGEDMRERTMDLGDVDEFTTNEVVATANSSANWRVLDPYIWQSIANGDMTLENTIK